MPKNLLYTCGAAAVARVVGPENLQNMICNSHVSHANDAPPTTLLYHTSRSAKLREIWNPGDHLTVGRGGYPLLNFLEIWLFFGVWGLFWGVK